MATTNQAALDATTALTNGLVDIRDAIGKHLLAHPGDPEGDRLQNLSKQCGLAIVALTGQSIALLGADTAAALQQLKDISQKGEAFMKTIDDIKKGLKVVTAFLTLTASAIIGDASGVLDAVGLLNKAIKGEHKEKNGDGAEK
jgi:hypothetical protein